MGIPQLARASADFLDVARGNVMDVHPLWNVIYIKIVCDIVLAAGVTNDDKLQKLCNKRMLGEINLRLSFESEHGR